MLRPLTPEGKLVVDYQNGKIPASLLRPVSNFRPLTSRVNENMGSNLLREDAWAALNMLQAAFADALDRTLYVSEAYRGLTLQTAYWQDFEAGVGNLAAYPGTSNHGWAISCDFGSGVSVYGSVAKNWMDANAPRFGWWPTGNGFKPREGWHYDFRPGTATEVIPAAGSITPIEEDFLTEAQYNELKAATDILGEQNRANAAKLDQLLKAVDIVGGQNRDTHTGLNAVGDSTRETLAAVNIVGNAARVLQSSVDVVGEQNRATHGKVDAVLVYVTESRRRIMEGLDNLGNVLTQTRTIATDTKNLASSILAKVTK